MERKRERMKRVLGREREKSYGESGRIMKGREGEK